MFEQSTFSLKEDCRLRYMTRGPSLSPTTACTNDPTMPRLVIKSHQTPPTRSNQQLPTNLLDNTRYITLGTPDSAKPNTHMYTNHDTNNHESVSPYSLVCYFQYDSPHGSSHHHSMPLNEVGATAITPEPRRRPVPRAPVGAFLKGAHHSAGRGSIYYYSL